MPKSLYICYFGVREPLVQTQVIPYLVEIGKGGTEVSLLTFEPRDDAERLRGGDEAAVRRALAEKGIKWYWLRYHKRPSVPATAWDILSGTFYVRRLLEKERFDILHCRVHIPMLMGALARRLSRQKPKLLFDIRGFFPEEYTDAGIWPEGGWLYRSAKRVERWLMKEADGFVVLTEKAREILFPESRESGYDKLGRPVEVIPCCVDLERFGSINGTSRTEMRRKLGIGERNVITYVGSFGGWYLSDNVLDLYQAAREQDADVFAMILTQRDSEKAAAALRAKGFKESDFLVRSVRPEEIAAYLSAADTAVSFIKPCYSKLSSSPTKLAEYLACGLPIIANRGVGDVDALIAENKVGVLLADMDAANYLSGLREVEALDDISLRCRETARREFDLKTIGGDRYRRIYGALLGKDN